MSLETVLWHELLLTLSEIALNLLRVLSYYVDVLSLNFSSVFTVQVNTRVRQELSLALPG